ncbi:P-loop containing nucleoside triphosphate hydrolase protein [Zopfochytrium polystomum]|nr:P-loop containing nucleoside triphosphate hydrolase protein [Zopfochytrium polystomum]
MSPSPSAAADCPSFELPPTPQDAGPSPFESASLLSILTFQWLTPLFLKGWKRPLEMSDLWRVSPSLDTVKLADKFEAAWTADLAHPSEKKPAEGRRLRRVLLGLFWGEFWPLGMLRLVSDMRSTFSPLLVKYLIDYAAEAYYGERSDMSPAYVLSVALFLIQVIGSLAYSAFLFRSNLVSVRVRVSLSSAIYRKSLRLSSGARQEFNSGRVVNMVSTDANRIESFLTVAHILWTGPIQGLVVVAFLVSQIGWAAVAGMSLLVFSTPVTSALYRMLSKVRRSIAPLTDKRVKLTTEALTGIRAIKYFAWEAPFLQRIEEVRILEIAQVRRRGFLYAIVTTIAGSISVMTSTVSFALYGLKNPLDASRVFSSLSWFSQLRFPLIVVPSLIAFSADVGVALSRIESLLLAPELGELPLVSPQSEYGLRVEDGEFEWDAPPPSSKAFASQKQSKKSWWKKSTTNSTVPENAGDGVVDTPRAASTDRPTLRNITLRVPKGSLVAVVGTVGSGKSSLLNAITGEMKKLQGTVTVGGKVGYVPQTAWIQNATLKENILFGNKFNRERYLRVLAVCALEPDLRVLPAGDLTSIGEKGINLSGGQRQRVNLARAVYQESQLILLDDPLSAVDAHVGKALFENCILGELRDRTRVLVTHQLHVLKRVDWVVVMRDGEIAEQGTYTDLAASENGELARMLRDHVAEEVDLDKETADGDKEQVGTLDELTSNTNSGKGIMQVEERQTGTVPGRVWLTFVRACGGLLFVFAAIVLLAAGQAARVVTDLWLTWWSEGKYDTSFKVMGYIGVYLGLSLSQSIMTYVSAIFYTLSGTRAAKLLHERALSRVMRAPVRFFDTTPLGRIVNRFSKDQDSIDNSLMDNIQSFASTMASAFATIFLIVYATPLFAAPLIPMLVVYYSIQRLYRQTSRELKRLESISRSPLYANFGETLTGLSTIRAFREEARFTKNNDAATNGSNATYFLLIASARWLGLRLELIGAVLIFCACVFGIVATKSISPALLGLALSYALQVTQIFNACIIQLTNAEIAMNSVERVGYYSDEIAVEAAAINPHNRPPKNWPTQGSVCFSNVSLRYAPELPLVLDRVSFSVNGGERVGIVGRTGSGKSSLMQALFRMVEVSNGAITVDGVDTSSLGLTDLRRGLAIIPQDPTLFGGTFRSNLDPFSEHSDAQMWDALERAGLKRSVGELLGDKGLDAPVAEGGENLSVGQRQLLCLARAMLKDPRILVMDEATANVDYETDAWIQKSLREDFAEATVLTIAHRLNTVVDYDRVLVMGDGTVLEFDEPAVLLRREGSVFGAMVGETGAANAALLKSVADGAATQRRKRAFHVDT